MRIFSSVLLVSSVCCSWSDWAAAQPATSAADPSEQTPAPSDQGQSDSACFPECRSGFLCHQGQCISACNPACAQGEVCVGAGVCQAAEAAQAPATPQASPPPPAQPGQAQPVQAQPTVPPSGGASELSAVDASSTEPPPGKGPRGTSLHVNALGLLQFGLIPRIEFGASTSFLLGAHFFNTGALSHVVIADPDGEESLDFSYGVNVGFRHYFNRQGAQAGGFIGGILEYASINITDDDDLAEYHTTLIVPAGDAGYRWAWDSFLLSLGGLLGVAIPVDETDTPIGPNGCAYEDSCDSEVGEPEVYFMAAIELGFFL